MFASGKLWVAAALAVAVTVPGMRVVAAGQRPTREIVYVVRPGDSLWGIARRAGLAGDRRKAVDAIMELNGLDSAALRPGQRLRLPAS